MNRTWGIRDLKHRLRDGVVAQALLSFLAAATVIRLLRPDMSPLAWLAHTVFCTALAAAFLTHRRGRDARATGGDPSAVVRAERMIRRGEIPEDPGERASVRLVVVRRLRLLRRTRWAPPLFLGMTVLTLGSAAAAGPWTLFLITSGVWLAVGGTLLWTRRRTFRLLRAMAEALAAADPGPSPAP
ncbi:hypothetical protein [Streptomyces tsukubensis]|uniref:Uncharacterized protein n=1 Tax=Streptomyces tsukubensis TaxID=83656 RepID=A0A1V4A9Q4_9ACTN|nr:hypothetical protein [Streptomyces tsukubensis]OON80034.1 hypothetical protein B1H18_12685 [Streptomyces tsukubensis]QFR97268.1 hypothetical protein GBW32_34650 [Streptomyces tsukubensis]